MSNAPEILPPAYDPAHAESTWYPLWEKAGHFAPDMKAQAEPFCIVIPPPNVTGSLHMGHALTMTLEDVLTRWRRMQGRKTLWLPGTDHAGIATQMVVERDLAKTLGKSRHDLGRAEFLKRVWEWKRTYGDRITNQLRVLGCSLDWTRERFTMDEGLSRAVVEVFVRLHEEGLIYRTERLVNWCPRCHTALSDLEVDHEENVQGELWSFAYPLAETSGEIVVATTRPETMLGDTAVAVHPDDPRYRALIGAHVRHPILGYQIPIVADPVLVDPKFGTGAVKVTPAHDFNDFETGRRHKLVLFNIFDIDAKIRPEPDLHPSREAGVEPGTAAVRKMRAEIDLVRWRTYAGLDRKVARKQVKEELKTLGLERKSEAYVMAIGGCQRCETVVEPSLSVQWFVKAKPLAEPALEAVRSGTTKIIPDTWVKTYYHWMENIQDWCISRQLWWGHRIPAWYCRACDHGTGSDDNPRFESSAQPIVSRTPPTKCPRCGGSSMVQDPDVLDTWFSSALWPFSTLGWPDRTEDLKAFYPVSVMETGFDILFFWVARMMMMGCKLMGKPPFPVIYLHAMVRDKFGDKMSKTRGNVIDPLHLIHGCSAQKVSPQFKDEYPEGFPAFGADAMRFTLAALSASGRDIKLSVERIAGYRAFANKIWNAARFMLMRLSGRPKPLSEVMASLKPADRFILSRLASTAAEVSASLEAYRFSEAAQATYAFFWNELCDWYIELVKPRLAGDDLVAKTAAESVLVYTLDNALRLLHPFMPFITEEIWQKLPIDRPTSSIMVAPYPHGLESLVSGEIEAEYKLVQDAIIAIRTIRAESNVAPSKPIVAYVSVPDAEDRRRLALHAGEIKALARVETLTIAAQVEKMANTAGKVLERMEVAVPLVGLVDFAEEAARIKKAIDKTAAERDRLVGKLGNASFVARAPPAVVEKDRARAAELEAMLVKLQASLAELPQS
jgi:valyl-tRNA synthetase